MTKDYKTIGLSLSLDTIEKLRKYARDFYKGNASMTAEILLRDSLDKKERAEEHESK